MIANGNDGLDALLSAPLPNVVDEGFSNRVSVRIAANERRDAALEIGGIIAALVLVVLFVPLGGVAQTVMGAAIALGTSLPLAVACAALVLTQSAARLLAD